MGRDGGCAAWERSSLLKAPFNVLLVVKDLLLTLKPDGHLRELFLPVTSMVGILKAERRLTYR